MKVGELVDFWGITFEVDGAAGGGYHQCKGCDAQEGSMVPAGYCEKGMELGCAGKLYPDGLPDKYPDNAFVFTLQPCNVDEKFFAKAPAPRYWKQITPLPPAGSPYPPLLPLSRSGQG